MPFFPVMDYSVVSNHRFGPLYCQQSAQLDFIVEIHLPKRKEKKRYETRGFASILSFKWRFINV